MAASAAIAEFEATVSEPVPREALSSTTTVPPLSTAPPEKLLLPERTSVPAPFWRSDPGPVNGAVTLRVRPSPSCRERIELFEIPAVNARSPEAALNACMFVTVRPKATVCRLAELLVIPPVTVSLCKGLVPVSV